MHNQTRKFITAELFVTFFYIGKIKFAPGTFGSAAALPLFWLMSKLVPLNDLEHIVSNLCYQLIVISLLFVIGTYYTDLYMQQKGKHDPKEVVIDEVVGQLLTCALCSLSILLLIAHKIINPALASITLLSYYIAPFILFRFFDIFKPWPISFVDQKMKSAFGVMLDDVLAALFASTFLYIIILLSINTLNYTV